MNGISGQLPHLGVLRLVGADTLAFLQGQISNDSRALAEGRSLLAAYSTPQGRVLSILHLLPHSSGVLGILPRELVAATAERLRRYVMRSKVRIEDAGAEMSVVGLYGAPPPGAAKLRLPETAGAYAETDGVGVAAVDPPPARATARHWVVGASARLADLGLLGDAADAGRREEQWRLADIGAGMPQVYAASSELFVAQMLNLDLVGGISFTKGCFTGQEIIARTQHLGRIKRRMFRLGLPQADWRIGGTVHLADGRSGRLTEIARAGAAYEGLAVLPLEAAALGRDDEAPPLAVEADGQPRPTASELTLPYPLTGSTPR